jgi:transcriptional regulator with XRE-family HTH domain
MTFYEKFRVQCAKKGVSASAAAKAVGLSNAAATGWKNGKEPQDVTVQKLADYFGCTVSDLTEDKEKAPPTSGDAELEEIIFQMETRPDMKLLFNRMKNATDVELKAIAVAWDALNKRGES